MAQASSYIDSSQRIEGLISASEDLVLAGHLVGELKSSHGLIVDPSGIAEADISARRVEVHGVVVGNVVASEDVIVTRTGQVQGSIKARRVQVQLGGRIDAEVTSGEGAQPARAARRAPVRRTPTRPATPRRDSTAPAPNPGTVERTPPVAEEPERPPAKKTSRGRAKRKSATKTGRAARAPSDEIVEIPEQETVEDTA
jgi:cytoskeletal protein CcmA (bactofilin family)